MNPFLLPRGVAMGLIATSVVGLAATVAAGSPLTWAATIGLPGTADAIAVGFTFDPLSTVLLGFLAGIAWLVASYASRNLLGQPRYTRFALLATAATLGLAVMVTGASLPMIALGWTLSGLAISGLVGHAQADSAQQAAGYVRRWLLTSDAALWLGVVAAIAVLPTVNRGGEFAAGTATTAVAGMLLVAAMIRSALFPVSRWLPETGEAPSPLSAFLHAGVVNGAGLLVLLMWPLFSVAPLVLGSLIVLGALSVVVGTWRGRVRADVKGQLASSTTAQMGFMSIQLGIGLPAAALLHLMGHGFYKAWLFLRAGGAVTRSRWSAPSRSAVVGSGTTPVRLRIVVGVGAAAVLGGPAVALSVAKLGPAGLLPAMLALTAVGVGAGAARSGAARMVAAALGATYLWFLLAWETAFSSVLPVVAVWPTVLALAWLVLVAAVGLGTAVGVARLTGGTWPAMWVRLARTTLPPAVQQRLRRAHTASTAPAPVSVTDVASDRVETQELVEIVGSVVGPVWPLRDFVAVNHLAGTVGLPFADVDAIARDVHGASVYQTPERFLAMLADGTISASALEAQVAGRASADDDSTPRTLGGLVDATRAAVDVPSPGVGRAPSGAEVPAAVAGLWCRASWSKTSSDDNPWAALHRAASDATTADELDALLGAQGAASWIAGLPADPTDALSALLAAHSEDRDRRLDAGIAAIRALPGWAGHAQWRAWQGQTDALAALVATHLAVATLHGDGSAPARTGQPDPAVVQWRALADIWQQALENQFRAPLVEELGRAYEAAVTGREQPVVRASLVFCIDVRSERMRRAIERTGPYRTVGYAGFFGAALRYQTEVGASFDQCPALISPNRGVAPATIATGRQQSLRSDLLGAQQAVSASPVLPLVVAEFGGLLAGVGSAVQNGLSARWHHTGEQWGAIAHRWGPRELGAPTAAAQSEVPGYSVADLTGLARDFLRLTGLRAPYGDLIVLVGHGATVENNAYAAAYDCGACGGNSGHINARVLAAALNHPAVREQLATEGWGLPDSCSAIAAVHNTTTDEIDFDPYSAVDSGALTALSDDLARARDAVLAERVALLPAEADAAVNPIGPIAAADLPSVRDHVIRRGTDWAQPLPEWALAGNAAIVVGPRELTEHLDLAGRVFLHSYDPTTDDEQWSALTTILTAPVVVAHWINSQYYLSTVAPSTFGAGDKTTHNVVGDVGVTSGAHGDLRSGLPWQSVQSMDPALGTAQLTPNSAPRGGHQALRLLVAVAAPTDAISAIVAQSTTLTGLVASRWITIVALRATGEPPLTLTADLRWVPWSAHEAPASIDGLSGRNADVVTT